MLKTACILTGVDDIHLSVQSQHRTNIDITECSLLISLNWYFIFDPPGPSSMATKIKIAATFN